MSTESKIGKMMDKVREAVGDCDAPERAVMEALMAEAEGWKMRLEELDEEAEEEGDDE